MDRCPNCDHELLEGFEFCHHCGTSTQQYAEASPPKKDLVEWVDDIKRTASQTAAAGTSVKTTVDHLLGSSISIQRRVFYTLLASLSISLNSPSLLRDPLQWIESWLTLSLFILPLISYLVTGFIPLAGFANLILGDELSLRRRLIISFFWMGLPPIILPQVLPSIFPPINIEPPTDLTMTLTFLTTKTGSYLVTFYFMGFSDYWRIMVGMESHLFRNNMAQDADQVAKMIRDQIRERKIRDLQMEGMDMAKLRRLTAGESSGLKGHQLTLTSGRARVIVFVQDFGDGLFIRWSAFYNASGRRLWLIFGLIFSFFNGMIIRWTGTNIIDYWKFFIRALSPASGSQVSRMTIRGGDSSTSTVGISEYGWNEVSGLEAAVKETIVDVIQKAQAGHEEASAIRAHIEHYNRLEALSGAPRSPKSSTR